MLDAVVHPFVNELIDEWREQGAVVRRIEPHPPEPWLLKAIVDDGEKILRPNALLRDRMRGRIKIDFP